MMLETTGRHRYGETLKNTQRRILCLVADVASRHGPCTYKFGASPLAMDATMARDALVDLERRGVCERQSSTQWAFSVGGVPIVLQTGGRR